MKRFFVVGAVLFAFAISAYAQYSFLKPIDVPGKVWTATTTLNNRGDVGGSYFDGERNYAFVISKGKLQVVGAPDGNVIWGMNNHGDVVGTCVDKPGEPSLGFAILDGVYTSLEFPGADQTIPTGINDSHTVVGMYVIFDSNGALLMVHGFIWKDGAFSDFVYPGSADTSIVSTNERGDLVGWYDYDVNLPIQHGFVCYAHSECQTIDYPGRSISIAQSINLQGQIVGTYVDENWFNHGFLFIGGDYQSFDLPGSTMTTPFFINSAGQIVGWYTGDDFVYHGFVAQPENKQKPSVK